MKGILLVNMGGANSPMELKNFLARMFCDPFILPYSKFVRKLLSFVISNTRFKTSWKKYELIGASPIVDATRLTMLALQNRLGENYSVRNAFSYTVPLIKESLESFIREGYKEITVIPLYPQASFTTTSSVEKEVNDVVSKTGGIQIHFIKEFYQRDRFVCFWSNLISNHIRKYDYTDPVLLFSAHSIPKFLVDKGNSYPGAIEVSARKIAEKSGKHYEIAYQSGMSRGAWLDPDVKDCLIKLAEKKGGEIVIIPISFVNENLETLYDIDHVIIPFAKNELGIESISRVEIPVADVLFIDLLAEIVLEAN